MIKGSQPLSESGFVAVHLLNVSCKSSHMMFQTSAFLDSRSKRFKKQKMYPTYAACSMVGILG
jgi:hypothetical protein